MPTLHEICSGITPWNMFGYYVYCLQHETNSMWRSSEGEMCAFEKMKAKHFKKDRFTFSSLSQYNTNSICTLKELLVVVIIPPVHSGHEEKPWKALGRSLCPASVDRRDDYSSRITLYGRMRMTCNNMKRSFEAALHDRTRGYSFSLLTEVRAASSEDRF